MRLDARMLFKGADQLRDSSRALAQLARPGSTVPEGLASLRLARAVEGMTQGSQAVRALGNPFFTRMADDIARQAELVAAGRHPSTAMRSAAEGAMWLEQRAATLPH